uniref:Carnitine O-acetyltransferase b n=1 Tax=Salmo trutta TaxID=8032 RepID=A0A674EIE8_SALTR
CTVETLEPLIPEEELVHTRKKIQKFCGEGGLGPQLQEGLERRARHLNNWIYDWWVQWAYLESRQPLPMHSNPAISLPKWDFSDWRGQRVDKSMDWLFRITIQFSILLPKCFQLDVYNSDAPVMGILTSEHRQTWCQACSHLLKVRAIEKGLFTLCLDSPVMRVSDDRHSSRMAAQILHVGGTHLNSGNRWFDKTLQFVVGEDDSWGLLYEQATAEGPPIATLPDHILQYCKKPDPKKTPLIPLQMPKKLINDLDIRCFDFQRFGKELPKRHNVSPNSFIQVALQLAYYKVHNEVCASCDIASQRMFRGGRTDYIRSPTNQMLKFVLAFDDPTISLELLRKAVETYVALTDQVLKGQSIDRHLLGLKLQAIEEGLSVSRLFMDTAYGITPVEVDSIATFIPMTGNDYVISR